MSIEPENETERQEPIDLDETLKFLCGVSEQMLIMMMNGLFGLDFDPNDANITVKKTNNEFISSHFDTLRGDLFLEIATPMRTYQFHIEFQMRHDPHMIIRMFEYSMQNAIDNARREFHTSKEYIIRLPKQLVIYFEKNASIPDELSVYVEFPNGFVHEYTVPTMKYWEHDAKTLAEKKLFNLLPLLLFTLRAELDAIKIKCPEHMHAGLIKAQQMTDNIICILEQIHNKEKLFFDDLNQIMHALSHLAHYLDRRYEWNGKLSGGADIMIKGFLDKTGEELRSEGKLEGTIKTAKIFLNAGMDIEEICRLTGLSKDDLL